MASVRSRDTKPELMVRRAVHAAGLRFRLHRRDLPGCPDIVFPSLHLVLFVHGCFWHQHDDPTCPIRKPAGGDNQNYWRTKLARNADRDVRHRAELEALGWRVMVAWECEVREKDKLVQIVRTISTMRAKLKEK